MLKALKVAILFGCILAASWPAPATAGVTNAQVTGNEYTATLSVLGTITADLTVTFEDVSGLTVDSLGVSVALINPLDLSFLARLPSDPLVSLASALPLRLRIEPPDDGGLSFTGVTTLELDTELLGYAAPSPLRLYSAPIGGDFADITASAGSGSFRAGGAEPDFSNDYVVLVDSRNNAQVADDKSVDLATALSQAEQAIDSQIYAQLVQQLELVTDEIEEEDYASAGVELGEFVELVETNSGEDIPDEWSAEGGPANVAGELRAIAATLLFSLNEVGGSEP